jgi:tripeptide aminopeptidase
MMSIRSATATAVAMLLLLPAISAGQSPVVPADLPAVRAALAQLEATEPATIDEQIEICEIPAPPFHEQVRAEDYARRFREMGLDNVRVDAEGNVIGERPGDPGEPVVLISGHLDTVFPEGTDVTVTREGDVLKGPGIGDDCRGLAVVLAVARAMQEQGIRTRGTVLFVGTVGEEGQGNLRGVRHLFEAELKDRVDYFVSIDGSGLAVTKDAVGSYRYRVAFEGPGGHSYGAFGMPNPIHALGRAIAKFADLQVPADPKTTFNVGIVEGGTSVNSIPFEGIMQVDMRSEDPAALDALDARFRELVRAALDEENARWDSDVQLTVDMDRWGLRPAGSQPADAPIVEAAVRSGEALGFTPPLNASSTDSNLPISVGIPAITIDGGGRGRGAHSLDETWEAVDSHLGPQWALLITLTLAGVR